MITYGIVLMKRTTIGGSVIAKVLNSGPSQYAIKAFSCALIGKTLGLIGNPLSSGMA